ncbi:hypothetical protein N8615_00050 [Verrucomicrobiales bacterium]|nr:hypothetical protein [Verrucomicrobiales bacterium]MDC0275683.1 hypothetical protein [Verrucomicrobiales bacterium]
MSLRLEMLQVARLAPSILGDACELVEKFVLSQQHETGGFHDRDGVADLYYTCFAIDTLTALQSELPTKNLRRFFSAKAENLAELDFVHLCCLARGMSAISMSDGLEAIFSGIESYRTADGGYNQDDDSQTGSAYACFLAYGAYSDHNRQMPNTDGVRQCIQSLAVPGGAWANDVELPIPNIPATAAAVTLCRNLRLPIPAETGPWILNCMHESGGFQPFPMAPMPDLLTTAVALHALDGLQLEFSAQKEHVLDFVDTLWTAEGGFHGTWDDDDLDLEYTYYGLLALGHLAL